MKFWTWTFDLMQASVGSFETHKSKLMYFTCNKELICRVRDICVCFHKIYMLKPYNTKVMVLGLQENLTELCPLN